MEKKILIGSGMCTFCGEDNRVEATPDEIEGYDEWIKGEEDIQTAMPNLSETKREILMTGICTSCQDRLFGTATPEPIEYDLGKLDYVLGDEENGVVEFTNDKTGMVLRLDYNLMTVCKVSKEKIYDNGNFEEIDSLEANILEKYGFSIGEEDEELEFDKGLYDEDYFDDDDWEFDFDDDYDDDDDDDDLPF